MPWPNSASPNSCAGPMQMQSVRRIISVISIGDAQWMVLFGASMPCCASQASRLLPWLPGTQVEHPFRLAQFGPAPRPRQGMALAPAQRRGTGASASKASRKAGRPHRRSPSAKSRLPSSTGNTVVSRPSVSHTAHPAAGVRTRATPAAAPGPPPAGRVTPIATVAPAPPRSRRISSRALSKDGKRQPRPRQQCRAGLGKFDALVAAQQEFSAPTDSSSSRSALVAHALWLRCSARAAARIDPLSATCTSALSQWSFMPAPVVRLG